MIPAWVAVSCVCNMSHEMFSANDLKSASGDVGSVTIMLIDPVRP